MSNIATKLTYLNGTKQAIKQAINEDFEVIDDNTTFREYADEISSNNAKYKDLIPKETKNATNTLDISNSAGLDKALVTQYGNTYQEGEPTPDYPQEIQVVTGDNTIKVEGNNLFDLSTLFKNKFGGNTTSNKGITFTNNNGTINLNGTSTGTAECIIGTWNGLTPLIELDSSQTYTLKIFGKEKPGNTIVCGVDIRGIKNGSVSKIIYGSENTDTIELTGWSSIVYIDIYTQYTSGPINKNISIQLVKGSTIPTTYTPYVSQSYLISLGNIELCKIEDYKDRIYPLNGKWYLEKKIGKIVLDGSEAWRLYESGNFTVFNILINAVLASSNNNPILSDKFKSVFKIAEGNIFLSSIEGRLSISTSIANNINDWKNWLSTHNVEVYYALATPTTEGITESNYPTLYNQLNNIKLFEGVNHITMTNESGLDVEFDITYYKDWKLD